MLSRPAYPYGPLDFFDTLVTTDWQRRLKPFSDHERATLEMYLRRATELGQRSFFGAAHRLTVDGEGERVEHAGEDELRSMVLTFRHLWQTKEPARFQTVLTLVRAHVNRADTDSMYSGALLDLIGLRYRSARREVQMKHVWKEDPFGKPKEVFRAERVIDDWMNGVAFHSDEEKASRVLAWSPVSYEWALITSIRDVAAVMWELQLVVSDVLTIRDQKSPGLSAFLGDLTA